MARSEGRNVILCFLSQSAAWGHCVLVIQGVFCVRSGDVSEPGNDPACGDWPGPVCVYLYLKTMSLSTAFQTKSKRFSKGFRLFLKTEKALQLSLHEGKLSQP